MYKYGGAEGGHEELRQFCTSGFRDVQALEVPPEPSLLEALLKAVRRSPWIVRALEVMLTPLPLSYPACMRSSLWLVFAVGSLHAEGPSMEARPLAL